MERQNPTILPTIGGKNAGGCGELGETSRRGCREGSKKQLGLHFRGKQKMKRESREGEKEEEGVY